MANAPGGPHRLFADVLRWARASDWRPVWPKNRELGRYTWSNKVPDPGARGQSTLWVSVDVSGEVEVRQMMTQGWVAIGWFRSGSARGIVDVLAAMSVLPPEFYSGRVRRSVSSQTTKGRS